MSISGRVDIDKNAMLDLAIGAFASGDAVVLRSLKVMRLNLRSTIQTIPNGAIEPSDQGKFDRDFREGMERYFFLQALP